MTDSHLHAWSRWNLIFAYISLFYFGLCDNIRGPVYPEVMRQFGLSNSAGTWFFALSSLMMITGGLIASFFLKRWGYLRTFQVSVGLLTAAQFFYAASPRYSLFLFGSLIFGVASGTLGVIQNVLVIVAVAPPRLSRWMNGLHANYAVASLLAPLVAAGIFAFTPEFQMNFWVTGFLGIVLLIASFWVPGFVSPSQLAELAPRKERWDGEVLYFAGMLSCYVVAEVVTSTRLAQFVREQLQGGAQVGSYWTAVFFVGLVAGRILFSFLPNAHFTRMWISVSLVASAGMLIAGVHWTPWGFFGAGLAMGPCYALIMSLLREHFPHRLETATSVCMMMTGFFVVSMHLGAGLLTDAYGVRWVLSLAPLACLMGLTLLVAYKRIWGPAAILREGIHG